MSDIPIHNFRIGDILQEERSSHYFYILLGELLRPQSNRKLFKVRVFNQDGFHLLINTELSIAQGQSKFAPLMFPWDDGYIQELK